MTKKKRPKFTQAEREKRLRNKLLKLPHIWLIALDKAPVGYYDIINWMTKRGAGTKHEAAD